MARERPGSSQRNYAARKRSPSGWKRTGDEAGKRREERKRLHVARREAAYFDILIGESECGNP